MDINPICWRCVDVCSDMSGCDRLESQDHQTECVSRCVGADELFSETTVGFENRRVPTDCPYQEVHLMWWQEAVSRIKHTRIALMDILDDEILGSVFLQLIMQSCGGKRDAIAILPAGVTGEYLAQTIPTMMCSIFRSGMRGYLSWDREKIRFNVICDGRC